MKYKTEYVLIPGYTKVHYTIPNEPLTYGEIGKAKTVTYHGEVKVVTKVLIKMLELLKQTKDKELEVMVDEFQRLGFYPDKEQFEYMNTLYNNKGYKTIVLGKRKKVIHSGVKTIEI